MVEAEAGCEVGVEDFEVDLCRKRYLLAKGNGSKRRKLYLVSGCSSPSREGGFGVYVRTYKDLKRKKPHQCTLFEILDHHKRKKLVTSIIPPHNFFCNKR